MTTCSEDVALILYPEDWVESSDIDGFRHDNNYPKRKFCEEVAEYFLKVLKDEKTATSVMKAFYRREHHKEPPENEIVYLSAKMGTALLAYELILKKSPKATND